MAKSKKKDLVISNSDNFDQQEYDTAVGKLIRHYKKQKEMINCLDFSYFLTSHSKKMYPKSLIQRMIDCIYHSEGKRHHAYQYPKPPYSKGYFYLDSLEDEPVGLIVEEMEK